MPIPTETLYNLGRLNRWFAVSCVGLLASVVWLIWEDYDRPWRGFQNDYMVVQAALAHLDFLETQTEAYQEKLEDARRALDGARVRVATQSDERSTLAAQLQELNARSDGSKIDFGNADAVVQVTRSKYEVARGAHGPESSQARSAWDQLKREEDAVAELRREKEEIEDAQAVVRRQLKSIDAPVTDAQKVLVDLEKVATDAAKKQRDYSDILVKSVINMPLADFTAPKGTPARHEIRQLVLPNVRQELNYLQTYTTDRCTTCHIAIDDRAFTPEALARKFERALPAIREALRKEGHPDLADPAVPELRGEEDPELTAGQVTEYWEYLSREQQDAYFGQLLEAVNTYLSLTGHNQIKLGQPLLAHPNLDLFVDVNSPHPMANIGCTVCHAGNPQETDFVQAAHTPVDHHQEEEWKEKYYVTAAFVPNVTFATIEHYWDYPMLPPKYAEAGCVKCHEKITDISEFHGESQAKRINLGQDLFARVGCINCHHDKAMGPQPRVGPDLTRVSSKLDREFLEQWIMHPKRFRPSTWMPHFFLQENNGPGSENALDTDPVLRTQTEVSAMAHYLVTLSKPYEAVPIPEGLVGEADRGKKLFNEVGCLACHANMAEYGREMIVDDLQSREGRSQRVAEALFDEMNYVDRVDYAMRFLPTDRHAVFEPKSVSDRPIFTRFAPELSSIGMKVSRQWLFAWLKDPSSYNAHTRMPSLRLTDQEALDLADYLITLRANDVFHAERFADDDAHRKMADDLVFQILSSQNSGRRSRAIMEDEGGELTNMLVHTLRPYLGEDAHSTVSALDTRSKRQLFLGHKMIAHYGCYACHSLGGFETSPPPGTELSRWGEKPISQIDFAFFDHAFDHVRDANPEIFDHLYRSEHEELIYWAHGQNPEESITHTHAAFAKHKMLNPRIWDRQKIKGAYDKLKMPNFYFTEQQADALVTYLLSRRAPLVNADLKVDYEATLAGPIADGRKLTRELNCVGCHKIEDNVATVHQYYSENVGGEEIFDEVNAPPLLRGEGSKVKHTWLFGFLNNIETLRPWLKIRMPSFELTAEQTETLVEYFATLSQHEAKTLEGHLGAIDDFVAKAKSANEVQGADAGSDPDQWHTSDALRNTASYLAAYSIRNRLLTRYDFDPNNSEEDLDEAYSTLLEKVRFTAHLFDVPFPFAETPRPLVSDERFKLGEELFYELQCLACHVLGDPNLEGSNRNPSAPNLNLTENRLRQVWTYEWLQEPSTMQPGTQMPQWFPDGNSAFASYPDEDRELLEGKYGRAGEEQMQLLMDFVYNAGVKNFTAIQPGGLASTAAPTDDLGDDEEEEEEDEEEE